MPLDPIPEPRNLQPHILLSFTDAFGRFHVIDEREETVMPRCCTGGTNFALSVDWSGGRAECHWSHQADEPNNRSYVNVELWCGTSGFVTHGDFSGTLRNGWDTGVYVPGVQIGGTLVKVTGVERWIDHAADGSLNIPVGVVNGEVLNTSFNAVSGVEVHTLSDYVRTPSPVATPTASAVSATGMTWSWSAPSSPSPILEYLLEYSTSSSFATSTVVSTGTSTSKALTGLSSGTTYYARVGARSADGWSGQGGVGSKITLPATPTSLSLGSFTATGMTANWADTPSATSYELQYSTSSSFSGATTKTVTPSTLAIIGLIGGTRYYVRVRAKNASGFGAYTAGVNSITLPAVPTSLALSSPTTSGMTATWSKGTNGAEVASYEIQWSTSSSFSGATTVTSTTTTKAITGMSPGVLYYVRVRGKNANGVGAYTSGVSQTTLPAVAPGLVVASSPDGKSASLTFSPPGGVTGVDTYNYEYRVKSPVGTAVAGTSTSTSKTVSGLTPGQTYEWRASAVIDSYTSPWSTWITLKQAKPNTSAGDYFDGSTSDTADLDYGWTGAVNGSTSTATAKGATGWALSMLSGAGVLYRIVGGIQGSYAARVQITADTTAAPGVRAGQANSPAQYSDVTADGTYVGSMYVRPSRGQSLAAELSFYDNAGALLGLRITGAASNVPGDTWARIAVGAVAPTGAVRAIVRAIDVAGTGWSTWKGGDTLDLDAAMLTLTPELFPYFDGSTPANPTYIYEWLGTAHASTSKRTTIAEGGTLSVEADFLLGRSILDPNCLPPAPPRPPVVDNICITETGIWRRYFVKIPAAEVSDWLDAVPTFEIVTTDLEMSQARIRVYENPNDLAPEEVNTSHWISEQIVAYVPKNTVFTIDGVHQRVWAEVNNGEALSADHLLYGSNGAPPTWPTLSCGISYAVSLDLPVEIQQGDSRLHAYLTTRY